MGRLYIIGAGLAGLSAAAHARKKGLSPILFESTPKPGGRIRQVDNHDNGTHLIVGAYQATFEYLELIGARGQIVPAQKPAYDFVEPQTGLDWSLPASHLIKKVITGTVPEVNLFNIFSTKALKRFWEPLILAIFNTSPQHVSKRMLHQLFWQIFKHGPKAMVPYFPATTLHECFISPIESELDIRYGNRLVALSEEKLVFRNQTIALSKNDRVILALPLSAYQKLKHPFQIPFAEHHSITSIYYQGDDKLPESFFGMIGTTSQWVRTHQQKICVTISNPPPKEKISAVEIWQEIAPCLKRPEFPVPAYRVITEKMATPVQNDVFMSFRRQFHMPFHHFFVAGDWIDTGLPATIESAIQSGKKAAQDVLSSLT